MNGFTSEKDTSVLTAGDVWNPSTHIAAVLQVETDGEVLRSIRSAYKDHEFLAKLKISSVAGVTEANGLVYIGLRLYIPKACRVRENLFQLAHDVLWHFRMDKSYASLHDAYFWLNMCRDLEQGYIPSCMDCQCNKSHTSKPIGPLHPLPVPDEHGSSVAIDFVGPLPVNSGYNMICTMKCHLNSEIRIVPTQSKSSAEDFALIFFNNWYCENGLPAEMICDCDKLFVSKFWCALVKLTGVKLKMSSSFHPETDGSSERTNKMVSQAIRYHVERNQKG